jgi:TetR/AcrR family fatty acid metabolism transcriptional regulator
VAGPKASTAAEVRDQNRRKTILRAAVEVFARKGYHGCRIADVAREAGVAYGLVSPLLQEQGGAAPARLRGRLGRLHGPHPGRGRGQRTAGAEDPTHRPGCLRRRTGSTPRVRVLVLSSPGPEHGRGEPPDRVRRGAGRHHPDVRAGAGARRAPAGLEPALCAAMLFGSAEMSPHRLRGWGCSTRAVGLLAQAQEQLTLPVPGRAPVPFRRTRDGRRTGPVPG